MVQGACQVGAIEPPLVGPIVPVASAWHTRLLVGLMLAVAAAGTAIGPVASTTGAPSLTSSYLPLVVVNLGLLLYTCGIGLEGNVLGRLARQGRYDARRVAIDVAWAGALTLALIGAENVLQSLLGLPESLAAHALLPRGLPAKIAWVFVASLVGFSEEVVYRGYLQRQLAALSGWVPFGVVAQALLFGIAHGEQGGWAVPRFAVYALAFGWVALVRKSLLPGVIGHVAIDLLAGLGG